MSPGTKVPLHQHPQQEAFFILEGRVEFAVENGAALAWKEVHPGDMINIPPDAIHGFRNESDRNVKLCSLARLDWADFLKMQARR